MMSSQDMSQSGTGKQISQMSDGFATFRARIHANIGHWTTMALQTIGFAFGGLLVMVHLKKAPLLQ